MPVNILDLTLLFQGDGEQANRDNLLVGEVQVSIRRVALGLRPTSLLPMVTKPQGAVINGACQSIVVPVRLLVVLHDVIE